MSARHRHAGLALAAQKSITDPDHFRRLGERGMGPTPAARRARASLLAVLGNATRSLNTAVRFGQTDQVARYRADRNRARSALRRYDARIKALTGALPPDSPQEDRHHAEHDRHL